VFGFQEAKLSFLLFKTCHWIRKVTFTAPYILASKDTSWSSKGEGVSSN